MSHAELIDTGALGDPLPGDPMPVFREWFAEAAAAGAFDNPDAMLLATVDADGRPSARVVLCKSIDVERGSVVFFTNYESRKARDIERDDRVALVLYWDDRGRQVRLEGRAVRTTGLESDAYFASRSWVSQLGAWASHQSRPVSARWRLLKALAAAAERFGISVDPLTQAGGASPTVIPRPSHWGGYRVWLDRVELWIAGDHRLHDRAVWTRTLQLDGAEAATGAWTSTRLQP